MIKVFKKPNIIHYVLLQTIHPLIRTSQVSLSSNPDADFRYSSIYTPIGIYKGRVFSIKKVAKKSVDITRNMKKELKIVSESGTVGALAYFILFLLNCILIHLVEHFIFQ